MKDWLKEHKELLINACLAGLYVGVTAFTASRATGGEEMSEWSTLLGAGTAAVRFAIGYVAKHTAGIPTIPVDE